MKNITDKVEELEELNSIINDIKNNKEVLKMKDYKQHFDTTCYEHCLVVSYYCYKACKKLNLDYESAARAAMLHDMFLYDWRKPNPYHKLHAFIHGRVSYENASKIFNLNDKEKDMIIKHMWPVTLAFPKYPETFLITLIDKYCTLEESFYDIVNHLSTKKTFKHASKI